MYTLCSLAFLADNPPPPQKGPHNLFVGGGGEPFQIQTNKIGPHLLVGGGMPLLSSAPSPNVMADS